MAPLDNIPLAVVFRARAGGNRYQPSVELTLVQNWTSALER